MFLRLILFMNFIYLFISNFFFQFHSTFKPFADLMLTQQQGKTLAESLLETNLKPTSCQR